MNVAVTGLYAAPLALLFILLSARVIVYRRAESISLGDGDDPVLLERMRAQGNFAEYAPFGLLLLLIAELGGTSPIWLHLCGILLLAGRFAHGVNFSFGFRLVVLRVGGMALTFSALAIAAVLALPL